MQDTEPTGGDGDLPEAVMKPRRGIALVWLIPIVAAAIAGWLTYKVIVEEGPEITISFQTASGLEAGKTKIKFKDIDVGLVTDVALREDLAGIDVTASLDTSAEGLLTTGTRFWVVRARLGVGGIEGLDTLLSGSYIEIDPGEGQPERDFVGIEIPPAVASDVPGREFVLRSDKLGSLGRGAPIYYRGIRAGEVLESELADDNVTVLARVFVEAPFDDLVRPGTIFWDASGITVSVSTEGFEVKMESLQAVLSGGIAFLTPPAAMTQEPAQAGEEFRLFDRPEQRIDETLDEKIPILAVFDGNVRGLHVGAPVEWSGTRVGTVTDIKLIFDPLIPIPAVHVVFDIEPGRIRDPEDSPGDDACAILDALVARGFRAQLRSGSLITGQLLLAVDFFPNAERAEVIYGGVAPQIPTVRTDIEQITQSVEETLRTLAALPIEKLIQDARNTLQSAEEVISSPELADSIAALDRTLNTTDRAVQDFGAEVGPVMENLRTATAQAESTLATAEGMIAQDSAMRYDLEQALRELAGAARSIRLLAEYLEENPNAPISGKGGSGGQ